MITYTTQHVCASRITLEISEEFTVHNVVFEGGCTGNALGIAALVEGQNAHDVIKRLKGIICDHRPSSCPDQLAKALEKALER